MVGVRVQTLIVLGAVHILSLTSGLTVNDLDGIADTMQLCDGEVTGRELDGDQHMCVLEPNQNTSLSLNTFLLSNRTGIVQHTKDALLRGTDTVWLDVRLITNSSQELDPVFALNVFNGTLLFLADTLCGNATLENIIKPVQFLLKNDCDCQPKAHVPLDTPALSPSADYVSAFSGVNCRTYQLCDGEITGVEFEYSDGYVVCVFDPETNDSQKLTYFVLHSNQKQHDHKQVLNFENGTSRMNVRMITNSTLELDPAFALRLSHQAVLFIADMFCKTTINEDNKHSPVRFLLAENRSCNCDPGLTSIATTTASLDSSLPYPTNTPTVVLTDPPIAARVVLIAACATIPTVTIVVVLAVIICIVLKRQSHTLPCKKRSNTAAEEQTAGELQLERRDQIQIVIEKAPDEGDHGKALKATSQSCISIDSGRGRSLACSPQTSAGNVNPNDCWHI